MGKGDTMNKDEWLRVQNKLSHPYGTVRLTVDGYALALQVNQIKALKFVIMVYVDGVCKGEWCKGEADEAKRFCRPVTKHLYSPAKQKAMLKGLPKNTKKFVTDLGLDKTFTYYDLYWPTFGPIKRHLIANNKSIELAPPTPLELELKALEDDVMVWPEELEAPL
jgi:hypothetical protein